VKRHEFEHVVRAAADIVNDEIVVIGSQAVLAQYPDAPAVLLRSMEVDVFPRNEPERAEEIDAAIGDGSRFHATYGYYAHGVGPETAIPPAGWEGRLVRLEVPARRSKQTVIAGASAPTISCSQSSRQAARMTSNSSTKRFEPDSSIRIN
jgi:hypothetical protein